MIIKESSFLLGERRKADSSLREKVFLSSLLSSTKAAAKQQQSEKGSRKTMVSPRNWQMSAVQFCCSTFGRQLLLSFALLFRRSAK